MVPGPGAGDTLRLRGPPVALLVDGNMSEDVLRVGVGVIHLGLGGDRVQPEGVEILLLTLDLRGRRRRRGFCFNLCGRGSFVWIKVRNFNA